MNLRNLFLHGSFLVVLLNCSAQDTTRALIKLVRPSSIGLIVEPQIGYGQIRGTNTEIANASAMFVIGKNWALGATASSTIRNNFVPKALSPLAMQAMWIGGKVEYTIRPDALLHVSIPVSLAFGEARADSIRANGRDRNIFEGEKGNRKDSLSNENGFGILTPGLHLEVNLIKYVKFYIGADYRLSFLTNKESTLLPAKSLQGITFCAGLRMGLFDYKICKKKSEVMDTMN